MRFQRNVKMLRGQLPAAAFITVCFLFLIFFIPGLLVHTPGIHLRLPVASDLAGADRPSIDVAVDPNGRMYYRGQVMDDTALREHLEAALADSTEPLILIVHADRDATYEHLVHVTMIAREAGIEEALLATLPRNLGRRPEPMPRP